MAAGPDESFQREDDEEERAERAREFMTNINRRRPSRKRYTSGNPFVAAGFDQSGQFDIPRSVTFSQSPSTNPFLASVSVGKSFDSSDGVPLQSVGGSTIYREIDEKESLSKAKNFCLDLVPQPIRRSLLPPTSLKGWRNFLFVHLPILRWLWQYRPKQLIGDIIAGITIGVTHIPQGIGFSLLAGLPPVYGLYSSFVPVILYSVFGSSRHISVGTFPVVALMTGDAIARITGEMEYSGVCNFTSANETMDLENVNASVCAHSDCEQLKVDIAVSLSLLVGILMILMGLLKFGFMTVLLSDSLVSGYTAAAAFTIMITQVKFLFGLPGDLAAVPSGPFVTPKRVIRFFDLIFIRRTVNAAAIITAIICILLLVLLDYANKYLRKYVKKIPIHIPAQLIVVILATGISFGGMLTKRFGLPDIELLGGILPGQCFGVTWPRPSLFQKIVTDAFIISIIGFVINISQAKLLAKKNSYNVHPDQEFLAYGIMNLGGSFFGSFPTAGALSRTVLQDATGGQTQLVGLISSGIVLLVILFLGSLFGPLPNATLAAIVVVALKGLYLQVRDIYKYYILSWADMFVWIVVFFATLLIGLDIGLGIGVLFSLFVVVVRTILPYSPSLGETRAWHYPPDEKLDDDEFDEEELRVYRIPKIHVYQFNAPLYFANVEVFHSRLHLETGIFPCELGEPPLKGCIQIGCTKLCGCCSRSRKKNKNKPKKRLHRVDSSSSNAPLVDDRVDEEHGPDYRGFEDGVREVNYVSSPSPTQEEEEEGEELKYHTIVIDCAPIGFTDSMGITVLEQIVKEHDKVGIQVLLAAPPTPLCKALTRHGFFKRFSSERLFPTITSAVSFARDGNRVLALEKADEEDKKLATNLERQLLFSIRPTLLDNSGPIELDHRGRTHTEVIRTPQTLEQPDEIESTV